MLYIDPEPNHAEPVSPFVTGYVCGIISACMTMLIFILLTN